MPLSASRKIEVIVTLIWLVIGYSNAYDVAETVSQGYSSHKSYFDTPKFISDLLDNTFLLIAYWGFIWVMGENIFVWGWGKAKRLLLKIKNESPKITLLLCKKKPADQPSIKPSPWLRFMARWLDYMLLSIPTYLLFLTQTYNSAEIAILNSEIVVAVIFLIILVMLETTQIYLFSTTFGKWLFGIRVIKENKNRLSCWESLKRSFLVLGRGQYFSIPILNLIAMLAAYRDLKMNGRSSWDEMNGTNVCVIPRGITQKLMSTMVSFLIFMTYLFLLVMYNAKMESCSQQSVPSVAGETNAKSVDRMIAFLGGALGEIVKSPDLFGSVTGQLIEQAPYYLLAPKRQPWHCNNDLDPSHKERGKTKKWSQVASTPEFLALPQDRKEQIRDQYFKEVIAPRITEADRVEAYNQFREYSDKMMLEIEQQIYKRKPRDHFKEMNIDPYK